MTIPYLMNCPHSDDGWCLACVKALGEEREACRADADAILARLRGRKGTDGQGRLSVSDIVALKRIAGATWHGRGGEPRP